MSSIVKKHFSIRHQGDYYSHTLYDRTGRNVTALADAVAVAERAYGHDGWEVFNGECGETRYVECKGLEQFADHMDGERWDGQS